MKLARPWDSSGPSHVIIDATVSLKDSSGNSLQRHAALPFPSVNDKFQPIILMWDWNKAATVEISLFISYEIIISTFFSAFKAMGKGSFKFVATWNIAYSDDGFLLDPQGERDLGSDSSGSFSVDAELRQFTATSNHKIKKTATLVLKLTGGYSSDGLEIGLSKGPAGISTSSAGNSEKQSKDFDLILDCIVFNQPETKASLPADLLTHTVFFNYADPHLDRNELTRLEDKWHDKIQQRAPELYEALRDGKCTLNVKGFASTPGTTADNVALSKKRIDSVTASLASLFQSKALGFIPMPMGEGTASQSGRVPREQRVEIEVVKAQAEAVLAAIGKKN